MKRKAAAEYVVEVNGMPDYSAANNSDERRFIFFAGIPRFKFL